MPAASSECRTASLVHCFGLEHLALPALFYDCLDVGIGADGHFAGLVVPSEIRDRLLRMGGLDQAAGLGTLWDRDNGAR